MVKRVGAEKQVSQRLPAPKCEPSPALVLGAIVKHVAALAEGSEVARAVVGRIVVEMRGGQDHSRRPYAGLKESGWLRRRAPQSSAEAVTPGLLGLVPPATISQVADELPVRPPAALTPPLRTLEADDGGELRPIERVKPAVLRPDRHQAWLLRFARAWGK